MADRLYRSPTDRVIAGVAGGLAVYLNLDPSLVRVAWVLLAILSGGIFILVYFVMMIVVPLPPAGWVPRPRAGSGPMWPSGGSGWQAGSPPPGSPPPGTSPGAVPGWQAGEGTSWGQAPGGSPESGVGPGARCLPHLRLDAAQGGLRQRRDRVRGRPRPARCLVPRGPVHRHRHRLEPAVARGDHRPRRRPDGRGDAEEPDPGRLTWPPDASDMRPRRGSRRLVAR